MWTSWSLVYGTFAARPRLADNSGVASGKPSRHLKGAAMSRFLPAGKGVKGAAGFLLTAIPALGAVLTGLAITGGLVGHMARDHPLASYGAFGLAVLAIFAGAVATFAFREGSTEEQVAIYAGLGLVVASLLFGVYA